MSRKKYRAIAPDGRPYALVREVKEGDTLLESSLREYKVCKNSSGNLGFWWLDDFYRLVFYISSDNDQAIPFYIGFIKI
jgi:hypothetical protein